MTTRHLITSLLALTALLTTACDDSDEGTTDAGAMTTDAGTMTTDAGTMTTDAGTDNTDAGTMTTDAGTDNTDAGTMVDPVGGATVDPVGGMMAGMDLDCLGVIECLNACADEACANTCVASGTPAAQQQVAAIGQCIQTSGCGEDQACLTQACGDEFLACQGGTTPPPAGDLSCAETLFCASNCGPTDQACQQACISAISAAEAPALQAYGECLNTNMCQDEACVQMNCQAEYEGCIPPGNAGCNEVLSCLMMCADDQCAFNCQISGDAEATQLFSDFAECFNNNMCQDPTACEPCATEYTACTAD